MWDSAPQMPGYQLTKNSCTCALQQIARDTPPEKMQLVNFHPSIVFTEAAKTSGYTEDTLPWSDGEFLPYDSQRCNYANTQFRESPWTACSLGSIARSQVPSRPFYLGGVGCRGPS